MNKPLTSDQVLALLNEYEATHDTKIGHGSRRYNIMQDVIFDLVEGGEWNFATDFRFAYNGTSFYRTWHESTKSTWEVVDSAHEAADKTILDPYGALNYLRMRAERALGKLREFDLEPKLSGDRKECQELRIKLDGIRVGVGVATSVRVIEPLVAPLVAGLTAGQALSTMEASKREDMRDTGNVLYQIVKDAEWLAAFLELRNQERRSTRTAVTNDNDQPRVGRPLLHPDRGALVSLNVRIPQDMEQKISDHAKWLDVSKAEFIRKAVDKYTEPPEATLGK